MSRVSLNFKIDVPFRTWKKNFDSQAITREKLGIKVLHINHEPNNEQEIRGIMEVSSLDSFKKITRIDELNKKGHKIVATLLENNLDKDQ